MAYFEYFQKLGWHISLDGYKLITKEDSLKTIQAIIKNACDTDIKEFGNPVLTKELDNITGPIILQIQKIRNISAPKSNETSGTAPRLLKIILTDGHSTCQAIEYEPVSNLDLSKTCPGTKILIKNAQIVGSYIVINNSNVSILGGNVAHLIERWQLSKSITKHVREGSDGPPPWVSFGKAVTQSVITDRNFKSLSTGKPKEQTKDEFEAQREEAIAEAAQGAIRKTFGCVKSLQSKDNNIRSNNNNRRQSQKPQSSDDKRVNKNDKRKPKEKEIVAEVQKPTGKISLFAFLEDKLPTARVDNDPIINQEKVEQTDSKTNKQQIRATYAEKYDASLRHRPNDNVKVTQKSQNTSRDFKNESHSRIDKQQTPRAPNEKAPRFQRQQNAIQTNKSYQPQQINSLIKKTNDLTLSEHVGDANRQNNRINRTNRIPSSNTDYNKTPMYNRSQPPPYYPQNNGNANYNCNYYSNNFSNETRPFYQKPNNYDHSSLPPANEHPPKRAYDAIPTNNHHHSTIFNNFDAEKQQNEMAVKQSVNEPIEWKWKVGDQCMAKYWEDNQFYNASITGVTPKTCMVRFNDYGNFEEVLKADCIPLVTNAPANLNRPYTGSLVFRRGGGGSQINQSNNFRKY